MNKTCSERTVRARNRNAIPLVPIRMRAVIVAFALDSSFRAGTIARWASSSVRARVEGPSRSWPACSMLSIGLVAGRPTVPYCSVPISKHCSLERQSNRDRCLYMDGLDTCGRRALNILSELHAAEEELIGRGVVMSDGKAGTIEHVFVDDVHGLRISVRGHLGRWPIATVKHIEG
jgi:hypothetical protein